jgi:hypothetical protein
MEQLQQIQVAVAVVEFVLHEDVVVLHSLAALPAPRRVGIVGCGLGRWIGSLDKQKLGLVKNSVIVNYRRRLGKTKK